MISKAQVVAEVLRGRPAAPRLEARAYAPANIALCKYWGKRDEELNLPLTSSLSVSLRDLGSEVKLRLVAGPDHVTLNGQALDAQSDFARRLVAYLNLFRPGPGAGFQVETRNTVPTAAGLASSASGFAAVIQALDRLFGWQLSVRELSILARLGSGSAARSIEEGFVQWQAGTAADGMDSYGERLAETWPDLRLGLLVLSAEAKVIGSRAAMKRTVETCALYAAWPGQVQRDLAALRAAIAARDFTRLGETAEGNALAMHATMIATRPAVVYWKPESLAAMHHVWQARAEGLAVYFTMDAGPNLKLLFQAADTPAICARFPEVRVVQPFSVNAATGPKTNAV